MGNVAQYYERQVGESIRIALDVFDGGVEDVQSLASQLRRVKYKPVTTSQAFIGDPIDADIIPMTVGTGWIIVVDDTAEMTPGWYLQDVKMMIDGAPYITEPVAIRLVPAVTSLEL